MPTDPEAGTDRPDDRYGHSRQPALRISAASVPSVRSDPPMATRRRLGRRVAKTRLLSLNTPSRVFFSFRRAASEVGRRAGTLWAHRALAITFCRALRYARG